MPPRRASQQSPAPEPSPSGIEILVPLFERFLEDQSHLRETYHAQVSSMNAVGLRAERIERTLENKVLPALEGATASPLSKALDLRLDGHGERLDRLEADVKRLVSFVTFVFGGSSVLALVVTVIGVVLAIGTAFGWWR